jgi:protein ImuA
MDRAPGAPQCGSAFKVPADKIASQACLRSSQVSSRSWSCVREQEFHQADGAGPRQALLQNLRARIFDVVTRPSGQRRIPLRDAGSPSPGFEGSGLTASPPVCPLFPAPPSLKAAKSLLAGSPHQDHRQTRCRPLRFGIETIDGVLPGGGLEATGLHEVKPWEHRDRPLATSLMLMLAAKKVSPSRPLLWVQSSSSTAENGVPYGPGLTSIGLVPASVVLVITARARDALWAVEEGLRSASLGAVLGIIDEVGMVPARRLILSSIAGGTPCLLVTSHVSEGISVAHTRWRVGALPGESEPYAPGVPGVQRLALLLERCRSGPSNLSWSLERWDASHRFRLVSALVDRATEAGGTWRGVG